MERYIAFLRAINVGGHTVKMETLRELFSTLGFSNVETFIASGNVIFESTAEPDRVLETKIEKLLESELGYAVGTFVRTAGEVRAISVYKPFSEQTLQAAQALNVAFLHEPLSPKAVDTVMGFRTDIDEFHVQGREVYWLCRTRQSDSKFINRPFERAIGSPATFRSAKTIARLAAKYAAE